MVDDTHAIPDDHDGFYSEHDRFMSAKEAAERYAKRIEELQLEVSVFIFWMAAQYMLSLKALREDSIVPITAFH